MTSRWWTRVAGNRREGGLDRLVAEQAEIAVGPGRRGRTGPRRETGRASDERIEMLRLAEEADHPNKVDLPPRS